MYEHHSSSGLTILSFVSAVLSLLVLIVFFVQAARVGSIKSLLEKIASNSAGQSRYIEYYEKGELAEFLGNKSEALILYRSALFFVQKMKEPKDLDKRNQAQIENKIAVLLCI